MRSPVLQSSLESNTRPFARVLEVQQDRSEAGAPVVRYSCGVTPFGVLRLENEAHCADGSGGAVRRSESGRVYRRRAERPRCVAARSSQAAHLTTTQHTLVRFRCHWDGPWTGMTRLPPLASVISRSNVGVGGMPGISAKKYLRPSIGSVRCTCCASGRTSCSPSSRP